MKWVCILPMLFIFYTHITIWALARSNPHGDTVEVPCGVGLNHGEGGIMVPIVFSCFGKEDFDASSDANRETKRSSRSVMEDHKDSEVEDEDVSSESAELDDYGRSDLPPVTKRPSRNPVQYRIFSRPPAPSPRP